MNQVQRNNQYLLEKISTIKLTLPKKQKQLCDYIIENYQTMGLLTVAKLADNAGVGTSTVIRVMKALGYETFNDLKKDLYNVTITNSPSNWWHLKKSFENKGDRAHKVLSNVWEEVLNMLDNTLNESLMENFHKAISLMLEARTINILGLRSSKAPALYFNHLLSEFYPNTKQLSLDTEFLFDRVLQFQKDEILFLITHAPYTSASIDIAAYCYERGTPIILVTNQLSCPVVPYASVVLNVAASKEQYSIVPTVALLEAIVIEIGKRTSDTSIKHLDKLDRILKEKNITQ